MRISDWSSDVCSSDLAHRMLESCQRQHEEPDMTATTAHAECQHQSNKKARANCRRIRSQIAGFTALTETELSAAMRAGTRVTGWHVYDDARLPEGVVKREITGTLDYVETRGETKIRSEEHTSELQSLMRNSNA